MTVYFIANDIVQLLGERIDFLRAQNTRLPHYCLDGVQGLLLDSKKFVALKARGPDGEFVNFKTNKTSLEGMRSVFIEQQNSKPVRARSGDLVADLIKCLVAEADLGVDVIVADNAFTQTFPRKTGNGVRLVFGFSSKRSREVGVNSKFMDMNRYLFMPSNAGTSIFLQGETSCDRLAVGEVFETQEGGLDFFLLLRSASGAKLACQDGRAKRIIIQIIKEGLQAFKAWLAERAYLATDRDARLETRRAGFICFVRDIESQRKNIVRRRMQKCLKEQTDIITSYQKAVWKREVAESILSATRDRIRARTLRIDQAIETLSRRSDIVDLRVVDKNLEIETNPLILETDNGSYALGRYCIKINLDPDSNSTALKFIRIEGDINGMTHPYVHNHSQDLSSIYQAIMEYMALDQIDQVFGLALRFLQTIVPDHPWNIYISQWPKIENDV